MKSATLVRYKTDWEGTLGSLYYIGTRLCYMIELPWLDNKSNLSCIPPGTYICKMRKSPKFGWCYELQGVNGRTYILIHAGNLAGSIKHGFKTHSAGCLLPGLRIGRIAGQRAVLLSAPALRLIHRTFGRQPFRLTII